MKKLPSKYYMDVVDGKLVITEPYKKVQKPAPQPVLVEAAPPDAAKNECRQCKKGFTPGSLRGAPQVFCTVKCRTNTTTRRTPNATSLNVRRLTKDVCVPSAPPSWSTKAVAGRKSSARQSVGRRGLITNTNKREGRDSAKASFPCRRCKKEGVKRKGNRIFTAPRPVEKRTTIV